jgi:hypothetical protein
MTSMTLPNALYKSATQLVMEGHLFDSLTLNKVLDYILKRNANFLLTSVQIGREKTEPSRVSFTLYAKDDEHLNRLLEELKVYGVQHTTNATSKVAAVAEAGKNPAGAYIVGYLPVSVALEGDKKVASGGAAVNPLVLVVQGEQLVVKAQHQLAVGDHVVIGEAGLLWG